MAEYTIREVLTRRDLKRFIRFPVTLYKGCSQYVPPLYKGQEHELMHSAPLQYCKRKMWLVEDAGGKVAGRICAVINPRYNEKYGTRRVRFGWFDLINDPEVARLLFDTAEKWAMEQGMDEIHGPLYYNTLGRQGMLVSVYDDRIVFARREFVYDTSLGEDWVLPLPAAESKPFAFAEHAKKIGVPEFEAGSKLSVKKTRRKSRGYSRGNKKIPSVVKDVYEISFPAAKVVASARVMDYEISAVPKAGGETVVRYVVPEGFNMSVSDKRTSAPVKCLIAIDQLPPEGTFRFEVRPRNSFGKAGAAITA